MVQGEAPSNCLAKAMSAFRGQSQAPSPHDRRAARVQARTVAEEAGRRSFLRLASHELRTPLNSIIGFSEIIARELYGPLNEPRYREHAEIVRDSGLKLLKLVNDMIELARLESGVIDLDPHPEEPLAILESLTASLTGEAQAREVTLAVEPAEVAAVEADSRALRTALTQLVLNAIAASPTGGVVRMSLRQTRDSVAFDIADEGPGVPIRDMQRILRPFEQAGEALTRQSQGAGLGLPIARLLVEAMGGKLRLHCEPGHGLCASVHMPIAHART